MTSLQGARFVFTCAGHCILKLELIGLFDNLRLLQPPRVCTERHVSRRVQWFNGPTFTSVCSGLSHSTAGLNMSRALGDIVAHKEAASSRHDLCADLSLFL